MDNLNQLFESIQFNEATAFEVWQQFDNSLQIIDVYY